MDRPLRQGPRLLLVALLVLAGINFSLSFTCNRVATGAGVPASAYVFWQCVFAGVVLLAGGLARREVPPVNPRALAGYLVVGATALGIPVWLLSVVATKVPSGALSMGQILIPPLTYGLAVVARLERVHLVKVMGIAVGVAGVLLMVLPEASLPEPGMTGWLLLGFIAPVLYAVSAIAAVLMRPPALAALPMGAATLLASAAILAVIMVAQNEFWFFPNGLDEGGLAVLAASAINALHWVLFFVILGRAGPVFFTTINYVITTFGVIWGIVIFGDRLSPWLWGALALMAAGMALILLGGRQKRNEAPISAR